MTLTRRNVLTTATPTAVAEAVPAIASADHGSEAPDRSGLAMDVRDLTRAERLAYEVGRAEAKADSWREQADLYDRQGLQAPAEQARECEREWRADAVAAWQRLGALKEDKRALDRMN